MSMDNKPIEELDRVLKHLMIGGKFVSAYDYVVRSETEFPITYYDIFLLSISGN